MAFRGFKRNASFEVDMELGTGGVNVSRPAHLIADNELQYAVNWWLTPTGRFATRGGTVAMLDTAIGAKIRGIWHYHAQDVIVFVAGSTLYKMEFTGGTVTEIGTINTASDFPLTAANFQGKIFIAGGGVLQYYDGTSLQEVTEDTYSLPLTQNAGAVSVWKNRLWVSEVNSSNLYYSGVLDHTDWGRDPGSPEGEGLLLNGGSFSINANDGGYISALSTFQGNLVVFKHGPRPSIHSIVGDTSETFEYQTMTFGFAPSLATNVTEYDTDTYIATDSGLYSLRVVDQVGNVESIPLSLKVSRYFIESTPIQTIVNSSRGYAFVLNDAKELLAFHRGAQSWYVWHFGQVYPSALGVVNDELLIGSENGQIYRYDENMATDDGEQFVARFIDKARDFGAERNVFLNQVSVDFLFKFGGSVVLELYNYYGRQKVAEVSRTNIGSGYDRLDIALLDELLMDADPLSEQTWLNAQVPLHNCTLSVRCDARVELANVYWRGAKMHKKGVRM